MIDICELSLLNPKSVKYELFKISILLFFGVILKLSAIDYNNTQVKPSVLKDALNWENLQDRNSILFTPNGESPFSGFIKKTYANSQVEILVRLELGKVDQVSRWKQNGIPLFSVEVIPGSILIQSIPESSDKFDSDNFHGLTRFWYNSGQTFLHANYEFGKRHGISRSWYENGNLKLEENYKDGLKDGNARSWYENGKKWMQYTHWNDKRNGPLVWWFENGGKRQEGNYKDGQRFGEWTYYNEDGSILYRKTFRDGKSISTKYGEDDSDK